MFLTAWCGPRLDGRLQAVAGRDLAGDDLRTTHLMCPNNSLAVGV